jgi:hypothetical protein
MNQYIVHGVLYGRPDKECFQSLDDAVESAYWAIEFDMWSPHAIQCPNGRMIEGADFDRMLKEYGEAHDNPKRGIAF